MKVTITNNTKKRLTGFILNEDDVTKLLTKEFKPGESASLGEYHKRREMLYRDLVKRGFTYSCAEDAKDDKKETPEVENPDTKKLEESEDKSTEVEESTKDVTPEPEQPVESKTQNESSEEDVNNKEENDK